MDMSIHCVRNELWVDVTESEDEDGNSNMVISVEVNCIYKIPKGSLQLASELIEEITMKELERVN
jgi:hypothetical protein